jgi:hypothetical protein
MIWKKKKENTLQDSKTIFGMVMLNGVDSFKVDSFVNDFNNNYDENIIEPTGDDTSLVFRLDRETVAIAHMEVPIPTSDIEGTAQYAYNWQTALEDTKGHKSHLIVSVMQGGQDQIARFKIFTKVLCSLLRITNSIGVYKGSQSLLLPKDDYLKDAEAMSEEYLPLNLWIYFGLRVTDKGNSGYTYGLKEFNKAELEIVDSSKSLDDIRSFLFDVSHYVLENDVTFRDGQTVGGSEKEKILIEYSKGQFVEANTFKLSF